MFRSRLLNLLDPPAAALRWGLPETLALAAYCLVVGFGIRQHVPWVDESQAWMLAQDVSLRTLLTHSLHYEGTPGLWHILLKLLQSLHLSFTAARWVAGGVAAAGAAVVLGTAPFPRALTLLLPFSFFLAYQDAVIARSYVLFALLAFTAAAMLRSGRPRPLALALVLGLLANVSLHGALASVGLALVAASTWRTGKPRRSTRRAGAVALLLLCWLVAAATMVPAHDIDFTAGNNLERSAAKIERQLGFRVQAPPPFVDESMAGLPRVPLAVHVRHGAAGLAHKLARTLSIVTFPLATSRVPGLLLALLVLAQAWLGPRRSEGTGGAVGRIGLAPWLLMVAVFTSLYLAPRHVGTVFTAFVVAAWLTWPRQESPGPSGLKQGAPGLERLTALVFMVVVGMQIGWTGHALYREHTLPYSPDRMTADYLKAQGVGSAAGLSAAGYYYYSVGPLLYFPRNVYINQPPHRYWLWSTSMRSYSTVAQVLAARPALLVVGGLVGGPDYEITREWEAPRELEPGVTREDVYGIRAYFRQHGYVETRLFCGHSWMRASYSEQICATVMQPAQAPAVR